MFYYKTIYWLIILAVLVCLPLSAGASFWEEWLEGFFEDSSALPQDGQWTLPQNSENSVQITNQLNVSASTGGNVAGEGETVEGKAKAEIEIENIINGQSVEPVDIEIESDQGEAGAEAEQAITYPDEAGQVKVEQEIRINHEVEKKEAQVEIENGNPEELEKTEQKEEKPADELTEETDSAGPVNLTETADSNQPKLITKISHQVNQWWSSFLGGLKEKLANIVIFWRD